MTTAEREALIARHIERDPNRPWAGSERLVDFHTPVWALIGYYKGGAREDATRVAEDYELPEEAVTAALAFYRTNTHAKRAIDAHLDANNDTGS